MKMLYSKVTEKINFESNSKALNAYNVRFLKQLHLINAWVTVRVTPPIKIKYLIITLNNSLRLPVSIKWVPFPQLFQLPHRDPKKEFAMMAKLVCSWVCETAVLWTIKCAQVSGLFLGLRAPPTPDPELPSRG